MRVAPPRRETSSTRSVELNGGDPRPARSRAHTVRRRDRGLRPGALLTVTVAGKNYPILFLHTKSSNTPVGLGLRDDMFRRALKFKATLDKAVKAQTGSNAPANYMFLGDLNTMGMKYLFGPYLAFAC